MRLAFWRAGKDKDGGAAGGCERRRPCTAAAAQPRSQAACAKPAAVPESGDLDLHALGQALDAQAQLDHRPDAAGGGAVDRRRQHGHPPLQIRSAHPGRRPRERVPAAERRAQRGAHRARRRGGDQPGAVVAVARSGARDHQEEQARRAPGIRSGAAGIFAAEVAAGAVRHRPRSALADAGRARARGLSTTATRRMPSTSRASSSSNSSRAIRNSPRASPIRSPKAIWCCSRARGRSRRNPPASGCRAKSRICARRSRDAESRVEDFRSKSSLFVGTNNTSLSNQQMGEINTQLNNARALKSDAESKARLIKEMLAERQADRGFRSAQFRTDPPPVRTAGDAARAARRAVLDAARRPSPHQGIEGAARRSRPPVARGGRQGLSLAGERRPHRRRPGRRPESRASIS